jgi:hypothetical protein
MPENTPVRPKNQLTQVTAMAVADEFIIDGADGVRTIAYADLEAQLGGAASSDNPTNAELIKSVGNNPESGALQLLNKSYDSNGILESAAVLWPDGSTGVFTTTLKNLTWMDYDAFTVTHADSGKTVTQAAMIRNSLGDVTVKPALTIS